MKKNYFSALILLFLGVSVSQAQNFEQWGVAPSGSNWDTSFVNNDPFIFNFNGLPVGAHGTATLVIYQDGDFGDGGEYCTASDQGTGTTLGSTSQNQGGDCTLDSMVVTFNAANLDTWQTAGNWVLEITPSPDVDPFCGFNGDMMRAKVRLNFNYCTAGAPVEYASIDADTNVVCPHTPLTLIGSPSGGSFSGTGVTGNVFDPSALSAGKYTVTYVATDAIGCETSGNFEITVGKSPGDLDILVCEGGNSPVFEPVNVSYGFSYDIDFQNPIDTAAAYSYGPIVTSPEVIYYGVLNTNDKFIIDTVMQTNSYAVDHDNETGDDRGGIALTDSTVYVVGDDYTARFDIDLLTAGVSLPRRDGLFSDLKSRKIWSLYNTSSGQMPDDWPNNFVVDAFIALDADLNPTTEIVPLSTSITMGVGNNQNNGIFAGFGKLGLYNGDSEEFYVVDVNSGNVELINTLYLDLYWSENWSDWGTLGFDGQDWIANYRSSSADQIVEHDINNDIVESISSFSDVSDLSSFTFHTGNNRLYFHYEGTAQFGGGSETLGYVDASATIEINENGTIGCPSRVEFTFNEIDLGNDTTICENATPIVLEAGNGYDSYTWNGVNNNWNVYPVTVSGQYIVAAVDEIGCEVVDTIEITVDPCLGVDELSKDNFTVYPNPTNGIFTIDFTKELSNATIQIVDLQGKVCYSNVLETAVSSKTIDANHLENGVYILSIHTDDVYSKTQIVVTK